MRGIDRFAILIRLLAFLAFFAICAIPAWSQGERILDYHSDIEVHADDSMIVTESIHVVAQGNRIRHGIYRDFPTTYTDPLGRVYIVGFNLLGATRDAAPEQTHIESLSNGVRIYLGSSNALVPGGEHVYTITYTTDLQIGFFADHDEFFWNVTGNGWIFPIDRASATVQLPANIPADSVHLDGYTGRQGSREKTLRTESRSDGTFAFLATRALGPGEDLTILLTWPKGYIAEPTKQQRFAFFLQDNRAIVIGAVGLALIFIYYVIAWWLVGRDPKGGPIVVWYDPPSGLSPAAMRYLARMGYDNKVFTCAVLDMAVKGYLQIREQSGSYTIVRGKSDEMPLSSDERAAANKLFDGRSELWLHNENHTFISGAMKSLKTSLKLAEQKIYFVTNSAYTIPPILFSVIVLAAVVSARGSAAMFIAGFACFWLTIWSIAVTAMVLGVAKTWKSAISGGAHPAATTASAFALSLFTLPFLGGEVLGIFFLSKATSGYAVLIFAGIAALHVVFHHLLKAPTRAGRDLLDKVEGFKLFLGAVEGDPLNRANPPTKTPEVFEKFLPFALALDVEHAWAEKFSGVLGAASQAPGSNAAYSPAWYSGSNWNGMGATGFASAMGGAFSSAISSSASAPGSSAGGGGGSGGGGGGGGGGGW